MTKYIIMAALLVCAILVISDLRPAAIDATEVGYLDHQTVDTDQILASFEREMNHQTSVTTEIRGEAIEDDVLYRSMNEIHWNPDDHEHAND